jgi:hypothetical protein
MRRHNEDRVELGGFLEDGRTIYISLTRASGAFPNLFKIFVNSVHKNSANITWFQYHPHPRSFI